MGSAGRTRQPVCSYLLPGSDADGPSGDGPPDAGRILRIQKLSTIAFDPAAQTAIKVAASPSSDSLPAVSRNRESFRFRPRKRRVFRSEKRPSEQDHKTVDLTVASAQTH